MVKLSKSSHFVHILLKVRYVLGFSHPYSSGLDYGGIVIAIVCV